MAQCQTRKHPPKACHRPPFQAPGSPQRPLKERRERPASPEPPHEDHPSSLLGFIFQCPAQWGNPKNSLQIRGYSWANPPKDNQKPFKCTARITKDLPRTLKDILAAAQGHPEHRPRAPKHPRGTPMKPPGAAQGPQGPPRNPKKPVTGTPKATPSPPRGQRIANLPP